MPGYLGDLWSYDSTKNTWIHISGSIHSTADPDYVPYDHVGEIGVPSALNYPHFRHGGLSWVVGDVVYMSSGLTDNSHCIINCLFVLSLFQI